MKLIEYFVREGIFDYSCEVETGLLAALIRHKSITHFEIFPNSYITVSVLDNPDLSYIYTQMNLWISWLNGFFEIVN